MRVRVEGWPKKRPSVRPGQELLRRRLQLVGGVEDRLDLGGRRGRRCGAGRGRRALTPSAPSRRATAARTSPRRGAARRRLERARSNLGSDLLVRVAERDALADERLGRVGRAQERVGARCGESLAVEREAAHEHRQRAERARDVASRREHRRLVLLQVAVVGERQALHDREQSGQPADRRARLAARELGDVGVQLLRHHRRPGRGVLRQPREAELGRRPEHELLADPREVREQHRRGVEVVEREVAVGDGVERVAHRVGRRRQRQRRARERAGAERRRPCLLRCEREAARGRAPASRPTQAGGGRASPGSRAAGACSRASACRPPPRRASSTASANARRRRLGLARRRRRRRAGTRSRPGRSATARRGSSGRRRRAALDRRVHVLVGRRRGRRTVIAASRASASASSASESSPAACRRPAWMSVPSRSYGSSSASFARRNAQTSGASPVPTRPAHSVTGRAPADRRSRPAGRGAAAGAPRASAASRRCR